MNEQNKKVPTVRFKGFTNDWEQHKLGEVVSVFDGTHQTPNYKTKGIMFLSVENINTLLSNKYISENEYRQRFKIKPQYLDVFMTRIGTIGKTNVITTHKPIAYYVSLALLRPQNIQSFFLSFIIQTSKVQQDIWKRTLQIAFPQKINKDEIGKVTLALPLQKEQIDIEKLLLKLDKLITLQQRKLDLLKQLKKGLLQKMFADKGSKRPILRFEGFTGNWEIRQLKELGEIITGNTPKTSQVENYSSNGIPWVTPTDINSVYTTDSAKRLSTVGKDKAKIAPANSLLVTCIASIGKNTLVLQESAFNQQINALIPVKNDPFFLLAESAKWSRIMRNLAGQTSMQIINKKTFSGISTSIPDLKEQKIIGSLFKKLDNTIAFQQQRISRVNEIKKSLLQQMFI